MKTDFLLFVSDFPYVFCFLIVTIFCFLKMSRRVSSSENSKMSAQSNQPISKLTGLMDSNSIMAARSSADAEVKRYFFFQFYFEGIFSVPKDNHLKPV